MSGRMHGTAGRRLAAACATIGMLLATAGCSMPLFPSSEAAPSSSAAKPAGKSAVPSPNATTSSPRATSQNATDQAQSMVASMSVEEKAGQLLMVPLFAGNPATDVKSLVQDSHVGSVVLLGNWNGGTTSVAKVSSTLQGYAPDNAKLLIGVDQEGGQVQHLTGSGFSDMPSAVEQGRLSTDALRSSAATWGRELKSAGVNVDLAPVAGTVSTASRSQNAPIGALDRDFGLDAAGNGQHAAAFITGMKSAGVMTTVKHFPGLGAVTGNTDFTDQGITDTTTKLDGGQVEGFRQALAARPDMVMMSLATYQAIDSSQPAAFSKTIIDDYLRAKLGFQGVVTSDSVSAEAVSSIPARDLGVRFVAAGGDLICIGDYENVGSIIDGLVSKAKSDAAFAQSLDRSAQRVLTLKINAGLAKSS
ncbi:beta-glucosidase [Bifidobacterium sp. SMB2]|uniref:beta-N-acetylhexosaminidase n=2 Tax=Bifidobacterium TaxID=1678 RepID=A0ABX0C6P9_9BIFI|nr:beta-glucosidase [Bifidobacterium sp. SMB2]NEH10822.1 beta-glucosidase [Bifidobacterium saimiriisciurei]